MTEELKQQGPYTVGTLPETRRKARKRYTLIGPTPCEDWWHDHEQAMAHRDALNAAYQAGQHSATPQGISEEGKGLGDAAKSGPGSAPVPSETDQPSAAAPIPIAPTHDAHPESYCQRCDGPNVEWYAPSPLWNTVLRKDGQDDALGDAERAARIWWNLQSTRQLWPSVIAAVANGEAGLLAVAVDFHLFMAGQSAARSTPAVPSVEEIVKVVNDWMMHHFDTDVSEDHITGPDLRARLTQAQLSGNSGGGGRSGTNVPSDPSAVAPLGPEDGDRPSAALQAPNAEHPRTKPTQVEVNKFRFRVELDLFAAKLRRNQISVPPELAKVLNDNFWNVLIQPDTP